MNPVDNNNQIPIPTEPDVMNQIVNHITPFIDNPQLPRHGVMLLVLFQAELQNNVEKGGTID